MAIAITLKEYLADQELDYTVLKHTHTSASKATAQAAHIPDRLLVKSVMLEDENGRYLLAVVPANYMVNLGKLHNQYNVQLGLATEEEVGNLFTDCELGAIPPIGNAYGIDVIMDESLERCPDVYFEACDHKHLIHMDGMQFKRLMANAAHSSFVKLA
jgi:Ala-tRNA(Pro) deacylase